MDRNFYYQKRAQEHQREISKQLADDHLLGDGRHEPLSSRQAGRLVLRIGFAVIVLSLLASLLI